MAGIVIDFISFVNSKSEMQAIIISVMTSCIYSLILYCILSATIGRFNLPQDNYFAIAIIGAMTSLVAVLLTFTLIQSQNSYSRASEAVSSEISAIELLYKRSIYLENQYTKEISINTLNYVNSIIASDWYAMNTGLRSETTEESFNKLLISVSRASHASDVDQETAWDLSTSFGEVVKARYDRLKIAGKNLPEFFYVSILLLFTIHIIQFFLLTKRNFFSLTVLCLNMAALGVLLGLIFVYDHPFEGGMEIKLDLFKDLAARISK